MAQQLFRIVHELANGGGVVLRATCASCDGEIGDPYGDGVLLEGGSICPVCDLSFCHHCFWHVHINGDRRCTMAAYDAEMSRRRAEWAEYHRAAAASRTATVMSPSPGIGRAAGPR